ncbi:TlpA family protein disulfide reductase [Amycolatopsis anabasis]|uniref:TlpA family protein disulfide reductase n=1 Tax=Amycolatopsis anabasis TaxID=1840409 RepID=UPI00131AD4CE|nr:thioredoxin family protein [Amycolatopsis anabasis]
MAGLWVLLGTLVVGLVAGAVLRARNGRIRAAKTAEPGEAAAPEERTALPAPVADALDPATPITLVQISTTFCAPCRHARAVLSQLADRTEGVRHVDLDVTQRPEVAQRLGVLRTPTTLALTPGGRELLRVSGVPKAPELLEALRPHLAQVS